MSTARLHAVPGPTALVELYAEAPLPTRHGLLRAIVFREKGTGKEHVVAVKGDLRGLLRARRLSQATMRNIRQNLFFAFLYNVIGVPIAAGVLYPVWGVLLSPMIASAAMTFSSVSVISNALRLRHVEL